MDDKLKKGGQVPPHWEVSIEMCYTYSILTPPPPPRCTERVRTLKGSSL